jgi:hypothetical protein
MRDAVRELLHTDAAAEKLDRRGISIWEACQLLKNRHMVLRNPHQPSSPEPQRATRRLMLGRTNAGRVLTLVIERTADPSDWLIVTGWDSANHERRMLWR